MRAHTRQTSIDNRKSVSCYRRANNSFVLLFFRNSPGRRRSKTSDRIPVRQFQRKYDATPAFFVGALEDAVHVTLHPDSIEDVRLVLSCWSVSLFIHFSVGHCWSIFTMKRMCIVIFSARRFCAKRCWSTISSRITLSGRGTLLQKRTTKGLPGFIERVQSLFSLFQTEEMVGWSLL